VISMPRVLIDACGWVAVIEAGINIDLALLECCGYKDLAIVPNVITELKSLNNSKLMIPMLESKAELFEAPESSGKHTDDQLFTLARENNWPILTVDTDLKRRLSQSNISWVEVSGRSHLRLVE
tara:strand:- start:5591 stop:5962 length:372 start_codon:yes stop_codon:yes gene_type:complete